MSSNTISNTCANCGKGEESSINLKSCTACKLVKYCNRECQIAHRPQHKKECKKRAAELQDEKLFKQPPPLDDCPICFLRMPLAPLVQVYMPCCGKLICQGCIHAVERNKKIANLCPFCRTPPHTNDDVAERYLKRMEKNDAIAIRNFAGFYAQGQYRFAQDTAKALELWHRAGELGDAISYHNIGIAYTNGRGVERDEKKAQHYFGLSAKSGNVNARHNLGVEEYCAGNMDRALKHWVISVEGGHHDSLENIKVLYNIGYATKEDYTNALRAYQAYLDEIMSKQRDEAAAFNADWKYY